MEVLVADDEAPALAELVSLLSADSRLGEIHAASSGAHALRILATESVDAVFLDIHMPDLNGLDLARAFSLFARRPEVVFVTADEARAVEAFDVRALDYVLKPVRPERLRLSIDRVLSAMKPAGVGESSEFLSVPVGKTVRRVRRDDVRWVKAEGDYSRLWTESGADHLVRVPISELERRWASVGFLRVHRSYLVHVDAVTAVRLSGACPVVCLNFIELPVSRRLIPTVKSRLVDETLP